VSAIVWALGANGGNCNAASNGKTGVLVSAMSAHHKPTHGRAKVARIA